MSEEDLVQIRREKGQKWIELGFHPYENYHHPYVCQEYITYPIHSIIECYQKDIDTGKSFTTNGRIMSIRGQGGVRFLDLVDEGSKIQLFVSKKDVLEEKYWKLFEYIDIGDIVQATGTLTKTKSGELSLKLLEIRPLTKCLIPPVKSGVSSTIEDQEIKYRQRYRDLIENTESREVFIARSQIIKGIREFMETKLHSMEVETPILTSNRSGANALPFETHHNALDKNLYLRVAPELYLKRLLVGGFNNVYEIGKLFRNEGISTKHNPEFTSIEYYQAYADYKDLIFQTKDMLLFLANYPKTGYEKFNPPFELKNENSFVQVGMMELVKVCLHEFHKFNLNVWDVFKGGTLTWQEINKQLINLGIEISLKGVETSGSYLFALYEALAEPKLTELFRNSDNTKSRPVFVTDYPVEVSPLAKKRSKETQYLNGIELTERFELFIEGMEVANAFSELNDPDEQAARFRDQLKNRESGDKEAMDFDEDYIRALMTGLVAAAGFGMGVDRIVMLFTNRKSIKDVILFPLMK